MSRRLHPAVAGAQPFQLAERDPDAPLFASPEGRERLEAILSRYPTKRAALLPLLGYAQELHGWISRADMEEIAGALELTPAYVWSVASFYTMYNKHPAGRYMIQVCTNIACHVNGAPRVLQAFLEQTGTQEGETTEDGRFTLETSTAVLFYTANDDFFGGNTLEQDPVSSTQAHVICSFSRGIWAALHGTYDYGGRQTVDGVRDDEVLGNSRLGATLSLPVDRANSIKFYASTGTATRAGTDYDLFGIGWQHRW